MPDVGPTIDRRCHDKFVNLHGLDETLRQPCAPICFCCARILPSIPCLGRRGSEKIRFKKLLQRDKLFGLKKDLQTLHFGLDSYVTTYLNREEDDYSDDVKNRRHQYLHDWYVELPDGNRIICCPEVRKPPKS